MAKLFKDYPSLVKSTFQETLLFHKRALRLHTQEIADRVDVEKRAVDKHLRGETVPLFAVIMQYTAAFGPGFLNSLLRPFGYEARELEAADSCPYELTAINAALLAGLTKALQDGVVTPKERKELRPEAEAAHRALGAFLAHKGK